MEEVEDGGILNKLKKQHFKQQQELKLENQKNKYSKKPGTEQNKRDIPVNILNINYITHTT